MMNTTFPDDNKNDENRILSRVVIALKEKGYFREQRNELIEAEKVYIECWNAIEQLHHNEYRDHRFIDERVEFFISSNAVYVLSRLSLVRSKIFGPNRVSSMMKEYLCLIQGAEDAESHEAAPQLLHKIGNLLVDKKKINCGIHFHMEAYRIEKITKTNKDRDEIIANSLNCIGEIHGICARYKPAMMYFQKALQEMQSSSPALIAASSVDLLPCNFLFNEILCNVGNIHVKLGNNSEALEAFQIVLERRSEMLAQDHADVALSHYKVGTTLLLFKNMDNENRLNKALSHFNCALNAIKTKKRKHVDFVAQLYFHIGNIHEELKCYTKALINYEKSIHIIRNFLGKDHVDAAFVLFYMGEVHNNMGSLQKSIKSYKGALRLMKLNLGNVSHPVAKCLAAIGGVYLQQGKIQDAQDVFEDSATITELITEGLPSNNLEVSISKLSLQEKLLAKKSLSAAAA